jgi:hypothetical protein
VKIGQEHRSDTNYGSHLDRYLPGRSARDNLDMGMIRVPVIAGGDRASAAVMAMAAVMVVGGHASKAVLGRVPMGEAMAQLGGQEGRGHKEGQQKP